MLRFCCDAKSREVRADLRRELGTDGLSKSVVLTVTRWTSFRDLAEAATGEGQQTAAFSMVDHERNLHL